MNKFKNTGKSVPGNANSEGQTPVSNLVLTGLNTQQQVSIAFNGGGIRFVEIKDENNTVVNSGNYESGKVLDLNQGGKLTAYCEDQTSNTILLAYPLPANVIYTLENNNLDIRAQFTQLQFTTSNTKIRLTAAGITEEIAGNLNTYLLSHAYGGNRWSAGDTVPVTMVVRHYDGGNFVDSDSVTVNINIPNPQVVAVPINPVLTPVSPSILRLSYDNYANIEAVEVWVSNTDGVFTGASITDLSPEFTDITDDSVLGGQLLQTGGVFDDQIVYVQLRNKQGTLVSGFAYCQLEIGDVTPPDPPANLSATWDTGNDRFSFSFDAVVDADFYLTEMRRQGDTNWIVVHPGSENSFFVTRTEFNQVYPTALVNDTYEVRVQAQDAAGNRSSFSTTTVVVSGLSTTNLPNSTAVTTLSGDKTTLVIQYGDTYPTGVTRLAYRFGSGSSLATANWGPVFYDASPPSSTSDVNAGARVSTLQQANGAFYGNIYVQTAWADDLTQGAWKSETINAGSAPALALTAAMQVTVASSAFDFVGVTAANGSTPITWQVTGLPSGASASPVSGNTRQLRFTGTVLVAGNYSFTVIATENGGQQAQLNLILSVATSTPSQSQITIYDALNTVSSPRKFYLKQSNGNDMTGEWNHRSSYVDTPLHVIDWGGNVYRKDTKAIVSALKTKNTGSDGLFHKCPMQDQEAVVYGYRNAPYGVYKEPLGGTPIPLFDRVSVGNAYGLSVSRLYMSSTEGRMLVGASYGVAGILVTTGGAAYAFFWKFSGGFMSRLEPLPGYPYNESGGGASDVDYYHCSLHPDPNSSASNPTYYMWIKPRPQGQDNVNIYGMIIPLNNAGAGAKFSQSRTNCYHGGPGILKDTDGKYYPTHTESSRRLYKLTNGVLTISAVSGVNWTVGGHAHGAPNSPWGIGDDKSSATAGRVIVNQSSQAKSLSGNLNGDLAGDALCLVTPGQPTLYTGRENDGRIFVAEIPN